MTAAEKQLRSYITGKNRLSILSRLLRHTLLLLSILSGILLALSALFHWFPFTIIPLIMDTAIVTTGLSSLALTLRTTIFARPSLQATARALDQDLTSSVQHPLIAIALEFSNGKSTSPSGDFSEAIFTRAGQHISLHRQKPSVVHFNPFIFFQGCVTFCTVLVLLFLTPSLTGYWKLPFRFLSAARYAITPGSQNVPQNVTVTLRMTDSSAQTPSARLSLSFPDNHHRSVHHIRADARGRMSYTIDSCTRTFIYRFSAGTFSSPPETVSVIPPPYLTSFSISIAPPGYTGTDSTTLPSGQGDCAVYQGSRLRYSLTSPGLAQGALIFNQDTIPLTQKNNTATCSLTVLHGGRYHFSLIDTFNQHSDSIGRFSIRVIPDNAPHVRLIRPGRHKILEPAQVETLLVEASDDLGIRHTSLYWFKNSTVPSKPSGINLSPNSPVTIWQKAFTWHINRLSLYPGDTVFYWATARDVSPSKKNHTATTDTFWFRVPTFQELHRTMAERESRTGDLLSNVSRRNRNLEEKITQLQKSTSRTPGDSSSWEQQEMARNLSESLKEQADTLRKALKELDKNAEELKKEGILNEDLSRKMEEIRKAVEDLVRQYGDSLLFPKNNHEDLSLSEMKEAVTQLQKMLPDLEKRLDNTLKYLESLKKDRELATLAMRTRKMAEEQALLAQKPTSTESAARQENLLDRTEQLKKDVTEVLPSDNGLRNSDLFSEINNASSSLRQELSQKASPSPSSMNQMSASLASLSEKLRQQTSDFRREQLEALKEGLLNLSDNTIALAEWQNRIRKLPAEKEKDRQAQALDQQALTESVGNLRQQLDTLPALPPALARQLSQSLNSAREAAHAGVQSLSAGNGRFSMSISSQSLRQSANDFLAVIEAMGNQGNAQCQSGSGMQESLRKMSGKQAAINSATAALLKEMLSKRDGRKPGNGSNGGNEQSARQAKEAAQRQQQKLAEELKKLAEKFGDAEGGSTGKRIEELEKEARTLAAMLRSPHEEITERQDRFLARMLQAALSLHREDQGKEDRISRSAATIFTLQNAPPPDSAIFTKDAFHTLRRQALERKNYPPAYRKSINAYFDSLGVLFLR